MRQEQSPRGRGRPPKDRGDNLVTREMLLRVGTDVVAEKGYAAIGIDELLRRTGISRCCFYYYFKNKENFGAELLGRYRQHILDRLGHCLADESCLPIARLQAFTEEMRGELLRDGCRSGCLAGRLAQEVSLLPDSFRGQLSRTFADWQELFATGLQMACHAGELPEDFDCTGTAVFFWYGWEGALQRAHLELRSEPVEMFIKYFFSGLSARQTQACGASSSVAETNGMGTGPGD